MTHSTNDRGSNLKNRIATPENGLSRIIDQQNSKMPADTFMFAGLGAIGIALALRLSGHKDHSVFVGQWVAPFLTLGVLNKVVKLQHTLSEHVEHETERSNMPADSKDI